MTDLRAAWTVLEAAASVKAPEPKAIYPLPASAEALEKAKMTPTALKGRHSYFLRTHPQRSEVNPGKVLAGHPFVQGLSSCFNYGETLFAE